jgi:hypothetical protein
VQGFTAEYSLTACPHNCSGRGVCGADRACRCSELYAGPACTVPLCPDLCGVSADRGRCDIGSQGARCICNVGFVGDDCSLDDQVDCCQMQPILIAAQKIGQWFAIPDLCFIQIVRIFWSQIFVLVMVYGTPTCKAVMSLIYHFISKALIFLGKSKGIVGIWKLMNLLHWAKCSRNVRSVEIKGSNYNETFILFTQKINFLK